MQFLFRFFYFALYCVLIANTRMFAYLQGKGRKSERRVQNETIFDWYPCSYVALVEILTK